METMRTLFLTMLLAGCGLHAGHIDPVCEATQLGDFHFIADYRGQQQSIDSDVSWEEFEQESGEEMQENVNAFFSDSEYSDEYISDLSLSESSLSESDGSEVHDTTGSELKIDAESGSNESGIEIKKPVQVQQEQTKTGTVIEPKRSVLPIIVGTSAVIGVGCALYKYVCAKKSDEKKRVTVKASNRRQKATVDRKKK